MLLSPPPQDNLFPCSVFIANPRLWLPAWVSPGGPDAISGQLFNSARPDPHRRCALLCIKPPPPPKQNTLYETQLSIILHAVCATCKYSNPAVCATCKYSNAKLHVHRAHKWLSIFLEVRYFLRSLRRVRMRLIQMIFSGILALAVPFLLP